MIRPNAARGDVVTYDFRRPSRISADRQRNLEASHEQLAQAVQRWVSGRLRSSFEVHLESVRQAPYASFVESLADPGATFIYDITTMQGSGFAVYLDPVIAFLLVERLLGGGTISPVPERPLTQLESVVTRIVTDRVTQEVRDVWKDHADLQFSFSRFEAARELIELTGRDDDVLVTTLRVQVEEVKGVIQFALPFPVLESFFSADRGGRIRSQLAKSPAEAAAERTLIEGTLRRAQVVVSARLPVSKANLRDLSGLKVGDVIPLPGTAGDTVELHVAGKMRFKGKQGRLGPHLGVQITETVTTH